MIGFYRLAHCRLLRATAAGTVIVAVALLAGAVRAQGSTFVGGGVLAPYAQAVLSSFPSAYYHLDESSGTVAADAGSSGNNAVYVGRPRLDETGVFVDDAAAGVTPTAYIQGPTLAALSGAADRTVEVWFETNQPGNIFHAGSFATAQAFDLALTGSNGPGGCGNPGGAGFYLRMWDDDVFVPYTGLMDNTWHYAAVSVQNSGQTVTITIDGTQPQGWVWNGSCYSPAALPQPFAMPRAINTTPGPFTVGGPGWNAGLTGTVDEAAVYPAALAPALLATHYRLGNPGPLTVHATVLMGQPGRSVAALSPSGLVPVATFVDPQGSTTPSDFSATVDWGDGTTSAYAGTPNIIYDPNLADCSYLGQPPSQGTCFRVLADHAYAQAETHGPYRYGVTVQHFGLGYSDIGLAEVVSATTLTPATTHHAFAPLGIVSAQRSDGTIFHCTATVVDSPAGNVIVTARHCGFTGVTRIEFAPGHFGGVCGHEMVSNCNFNPFGVWATTDIAHSVHQITAPDPATGAYDYAFITLPPLSAGVPSTNVQSIVGAFPAAFMYNGGVQAERWDILAYGLGYTSPVGNNGGPIICPAPALAPYTIPGGDLDPSPLYKVAVHAGLCLPSPLVAGSSGAPWINSANGLPNAVGAICQCGDASGGFFVATILGQPAAQLFIQAAFAQVAPQPSA